MEINSISQKRFNCSLMSERHLLTAFNGPYWPQGSMKMEGNTIRPAHMRTVHGIASSSSRDKGVYSVSAVHCTEDTLADPRGVAASGSGMDAPVQMPIGSVKAFFNRNSSDHPVAFGGCQRTIDRR